MRNLIEYFKDKLTGIDECCAQPIFQMSDFYITIPANVNHAAGQDRPLMK
jgi:hypothetical protein